MIHLLICDDDNYTLRMLEKLFAENPLVDTIDLAQDGETAIQMGLEKTYHIALMDIDMPGKDGIQTAKQLIESNPDLHVIFITAYADYAFNAYDVSPIDYILKPIEIDRVQNSVYKVVRRIEELQFINFVKRSPVLIVKSKSDIFFLKSEDIYFVEKENKKLLIHTVHGIIDTYMLLSDIEDKFGSLFLRTHKSYLVNIQKVSRISLYSESSYIIIFRDYKTTALMTKEKFAQLRALIG